MADLSPDGFHTMCHGSGYVRRRHLLFLLLVSALVLFGNGRSTFAQEDEDSAAIPPPSIG